MCLRAKGEAPDGMVPMEDDEDADRKVQESRARREVGLACRVTERLGAHGEVGEPW